jgi:hypothetical protein
MYIRDLGFHMDECPSLVGEFGASDFGHKLIEVGQNFALLAQ